MTDDSASPHVLVDGRWARPGARGPRREVLGIGRFAREVFARLDGLELVSDRVPLLHPVEPFWLAATLYRRRPGVYFTPGFNPPLVSPVPVVFTLYDLIHLRFREEAGLRKRAYYETVVRPAARRAARVLTTSAFSKDEILDWIGLPDERVVVVGSGVGPTFRPEGTRHAPGYRYLLHVGNRQPHRNIPRLLRAFARASFVDDVRLVFTGDPDPATLRAARELGVEEKLVFVGHVSDSKLAGLYRGALALVLPSLYEGFGLPALEAMACGVPVVASNVTSLPEVVGEAGLLVDPHDVEAIADAIGQIAEEAALREVCRTKGLERAKAFTWERTAEVVRGVLEEAVATR